MRVGELVDELRRGINQLENYDRRGRVEVWRDGRKVDFAVRQVHQRKDEPVSFLID